MTKMHRGRCSDGRDPDIDFRFCDDDHRYICLFKPDGVEHDFTVNEDAPPRFWPYCSEQHLNEVTNGN